MVDVGIGFGIESGARANSHTGMYPEGRTKETQKRPPSRESTLRRGGGTLLVQPVSQASGQTREAVREL